MPQKEEFTIISATPAFDPASTRDYKNVTSSTRLPSDADHPQFEQIRVKISQLNGNKPVYAPFELNVGSLFERQQRFDAVAAGEAIVR